jgi:NAD-dependent deacetylase
MADADAALAELRARLAQAGSVCVLTGAGMSAESGIPTFRDADDAPEAHAAPSPQGGAPALGRPGGRTGLWARFDPMRLASEEGFRADPALVWSWYAERRDGVRAAQPNAGHLALAAFERARPGVLTIVSQNVDDLHQRAGNRDTIRLHGDILADRWLDACPRRGARCDPASAAPGTPPRCADCGNLVRPGVVWFGENLPLGALEAAEAASARCEVMLVVGTSGAVWPAAGLAALARRNSAFVAIVNPHPSEIDDQAHALITGTAAQLLPRVLPTTHS